MKEDDGSIDPINDFLLILNAGGTVLSLIGPSAMHWLRKVQDINPV